MRCSASATPSHFPPAAPSISVSVLGFPLPQPTLGRTPSPPTRILCRRNPPPALPRSIWLRFCTVTRFLCGLFAFYSQTRERERNTLFALGMYHPPTHTFVMEALCGGLEEGWLSFFVISFPPPPK